MVEQTGGKVLDILEFVEGSGREAMEDAISCDEGMDSCFSSKGGKLKEDGLGNVVFEGEVGVNVDNRIFYEGRTRLKRCQRTERKWGEIWWGMIMMSDLSHLSLRKLNCI